MERSLLPGWGSSFLARSLNTDARPHQSPESQVVRTKPHTAAAATRPTPVLAGSTPPPPTGSEERGWERTGPGIRRCNKSCIESTVQWSSVWPGPALPVKQRGSILPPLNFCKGQGDGASQGAGPRKTHRGRIKAML